MQKLLRITIPIPCHENWHDMDPVEKGAFCKSCNKVVQDFTKMSDDELSIFFSSNQKQLCGRFKLEQLNRPFLDISPDVIYYMDIAPWKKFIAILLICFGGFLQSCEPGIKDKYSDIVLPDTVKTSTTNTDIEIVTADDTDRSAANPSNFIPIKESDIQIMVAGNIQVQPIISEPTFTKYLYPSCQTEEKSNEQ